MFLRRVRIRTLMIAVLIAGMGLATFQSSENFHFVSGLLCPVAFLVLALADTILIAFGTPKFADPDGDGDLEANASIDPNRNAPGT